MAKTTKTTTAKKPSIATAKPAVQELKKLVAEAKAKPAAPTPPPAKKEEDKKPAPAKKEGTRASAGSFAGKTIRLNMANPKVAEADGNNPKRGKCREWFTWYLPEAKTAKGLPVEEYIKRGGKSGYIRWDSEHELITLS